MKKILMFTAMFLIIPVMAWAASNVTFQWDANNESDLAGYRIYQTNLDGNYTYGSGNEVVDIPAGTETSIITVQDGTWFWVVTAYDNSGNESGPSNQVTASLDTESPQPPQSFLVFLIQKIIAFLQNLLSDFKISRV